MRYRVEVEVKWLQTLASHPGVAELKPLSDTQIATLDGLFLDFSLEDALQVKDIESKTNHDVKAIEYFIKQSLKIWVALASISNLSISPVLQKTSTTWPTGLCLLRRESRS